jgi:hypothetical protein
MNSRRPIDAPAVVVFLLAGSISYRVFVLSEGAYAAASKPASDGRLRVLARKTYKTLHTIPVGVVFRAQPGIALDLRT